MSTWGRIAVGGYSRFSVQSTVASKPAVATDSGTAPSIDKARAQLRAASAALAAAFLELTAETRPVYSSIVHRIPATPVRLHGMSARIDPFIGASSRLQTTAAINTRISTTRSSSAALGLVLSGPVASILRSSTLGLNLASPAASSRLLSSNLGLDLASPDASSTLRSSAALGLDLLSPDAPSVLASDHALGLDITSPERASVIASTGELNASFAGLYATSLLNFTGTGQASTSEGTLSGTYTGVGTAAAATSLTIAITRNTIGLNGLLSSGAGFEVRDQNGAVLFSFNGSLRSDVAVYLGDDIGLSITFSAGRLSKSQEASTAVSHAPITVSSTAAFNAAPSQQPQFEGGAVVRAGAFRVNGTTIAVNANDSIATVLSRVNASAAGVTAVLANDRITLTSNANSEAEIVLDGDTSGFLAATKLAAAETTTGSVHDDRQVLANTSQFAEVASGSFTINGASISVDRTMDSLSSIIARINGAGVGVTAAYDAGSGTVVLTGTTNSEDLITVANDTTGFLAAVGLLMSNTRRGHLAEDTVALTNLADFQDVTNGSFTVDGQVISVNVATDTVRSIVDRINSSGARVLAAYDPDADRIVLDTTYASEDDVPVTDDTSGFLAAAHLSPDDTVRGNLRDDRQVLSKTSQFGSVASGFFTINGVAIDVDVEHDTVASLVDAINASGAGVVAQLDESTGQLEIATALASEDDIVMADDSTGFLAAAGLATANTVQGNISDDQQVLARTTQFGGMSSGSFSLNGATIDVDVDIDTISTLIARVNQAGAGVTAAYDAGLDQLVLTTTAASEAPIAITDDTTGFAALTDLVPENTARGNISDDAQLLAATTLFASVTAGEFQVNGIVVSIDPDVDSLNTVIDRINRAGAGVTVAYDGESDLLRFTPAVAGQTLSLGGDTSGFLAAAHVAEGTEGTHVNISAAFDDAGLDGPLFDATMSVHTGTFTVNGALITVADDDSVASILEQITNSAANVTATYDAGAQTIRLTANDGSDDPIVAGNDTSGFLAAVKLDGSAESTSGSDAVSAGDTPLRDMAEYAAVTAGSISVNGTEIAVDPTIVSMRDLISTIDAVDGVSASLDDATGAVTIAPEWTGGAIELSDTSGLLSLLGIAAGRRQGYEASARTLSMPSGTEHHSNAVAVAAGIAAAVQDIDDAMHTLGAGLTAGTTTRRELEASLGSVLLSMSGAGIDGVRLTGTRSGLNIMVDHAALEHSLRENASAIHDMFAQSGGLAGSFGGLIDRFAENAPAASTTAFRPTPLTRAQLEAKLGTSSLGADTATRLIFIRAVLRGHAPDVDGRAQAARTYADVEGAFERFRAGSPG